MQDIQYVTRKKRARVIHIETELGIVNIYVGLCDRFGRKVESVEVIPDNFAGEPKVRLIPHKRLRMIQNKK